VRFSPIPWAFGLVGPRLFTMQAHTVWPTQRWAHATFEHLFHYWDFLQKTYWPGGVLVYCMSHSAQRMFSCHPWRWYHLVLKLRVAHCGWRGNGRKGLGLDNFCFVLEKKKTKRLVHPTKFKKVEKCFLMWISMT